MNNFSDVSTGYVHDTYLRSVNPTQDTSSRAEIPTPIPTETPAERGTLISMVSVLAKMKTGVLLNKTETAFLKGNNARLYVKSMAIRKQVKKLEDKLAAQSPKRRFPTSTTRKSPISPRTTERFLPFFPPRN